MKVLLVEDHPTLAQISCYLLRDVHGHEVQLASTGAAAVAAARTFVPDIVLLDLNLPDLHGYEVARALRSEPSLDRTVLVALTGFSHRLDETEARQAGIDVQFRKPMEFEVLPTLKRSEPLP